MEISKFLSFTFLFLFSGLSIKSQQLMTRAQVYDYNIGDVFEYQIQGGTTGAAAHIDTITGKYYSINFDTVFYTLNTYSKIFAQCPPPCTSSYSSSIGQIIYFTNLSDTMGIGLGTKAYDLWCIDTAGFTGTYMDTTYYNYEYCNKLTTRITSISNGPMQLSDSACYGFFEPYFENWEYGLGLGQIFHSINTCSNGFPNCSSSQYLRYFKKGSDSCGTYLDVLPIGIKELSENNGAIKVLPNPATDKFILESATNSEFEITIYTSTGEGLFSKTIKEKEEINIQGLEDGIYFVLINVGNKVFYKKLIVLKE